MENLNIYNIKDIQAIIAATVSSPKLLYGFGNIHPNVFIKIKSENGNPVLQIDLGFFRAVKKIAITVLSEMLIDLEPVRGIGRWILMVQASGRLMIVHDYGMQNYNEDLYKRDMDAIRNRILFTISPENKEKLPFYTSLANFRQDPVDGSGFELVGGTKLNLYRYRPVVTNEDFMTGNNKYVNNGTYNKRECEQHVGEMDIKKISQHGIFIFPLTLVYVLLGVVVWLIFLPLRLLAKMVKLLLYISQAKLIVQIIYFTCIFYTSIYLYQTLLKKYV